VRAKRLTFTTGLRAAVGAAEVAFIAVGTPSRGGNGYADFSFVYQPAREIAGALSGYTLIVTSHNPREPAAGAVVSNARGCSHR
jgi:UDPglucose 6-dehydrogenase